MASYLTPLRECIIIVSVLSLVQARADSVRLSEPAPSAHQVEVSLRSSSKAVLFSESLTLSRRAEPSARIFFVKQDYAIPIIGARVPTPRTTLESLVILLRKVFLPNLSKCQNECNEYCQTGTGCTHPWDGKLNNERDGRR